MPRPATGRKKEAILDAAVVEIASHGYHGTTVAMIARRAGVADGTIYLYFRNKEEILVSLFDRAMDRFVEQGARELADLTEPAARLGRIIGLHLELVGPDRGLGPRQRHASITQGLGVDPGGLVVELGAIDRQRGPVAA